MTVGSQNGQFYLFFFIIMLKLIRWAQWAWAVYGLMAIRDKDKSFSVSKQDQGLLPSSSCVLLSPGLSNASLCQSFFFSVLVFVILKVNEEIRCPALITYSFHNHRQVKPNIRPTFFSGFLRGMCYKSSSFVQVLVNKKLGGIWIFFFIV